VKTRPPTVLVGTVGEPRTGSEKSSVGGPACDGSVKRAAPLLINRAAKIQLYLSKVRGTSDRSRARCLADLRDIDPPHALSTSSPRQKWREDQRVAGSRAAPRSLLVSEKNRRKTGTYDPGVGRVDRAVLRLALGARPPHSAPAESNLWTVGAQAHSEQPPLGRPTLVLVPWAERELES
jgi:hypothetical protein